MKSGILTRIRREIPEGIWSRCEQCGETTYNNALERSGWICPRCGNHLHIGFDKYVDQLLDHGTVEQINADIATADPLRFRDHRRYTDRIRDGRKASSLNEAVWTRRRWARQSPGCIGYHGYPLHSRKHGRGNW